MPHDHMKYLTKTVNPILRYEKEANDDNVVSFNKELASFSNISTVLGHVVFTAPGNPVT